MVEIIDLQPSPKPDKRFRICLCIDGRIKHFDFGAKMGSTFVDHGDERKRTNYLARHCANPTERYRIENLVPSNALFSAYLLWGDSTNLIDNLINLNALFLAKYSP